MDVFGFFTTNRTILAQNLASVPHGQRSCVPGSPLGCISGSLPSTCLDGSRRCGTPHDNAKDPFVEIRFKLPDRDYLWGIEIKHVRNEQLSELFVGPKKIEIFGIRDEPLPCAEGNEEIVGIDRDTWQNQIVCHPPDATDAQLYALGGAYRVRLTLLGEFRQVWLESISVISRPLLAVPDIFPAPSPPPPKPDLPPGSAPSPPPSPPDGTTCSFFPNTFVDPSVTDFKVEHEPCGITRQECCMHKRKAESRGATIFTIGDSGCCNVYFMGAGLTSTTVPVYQDSRKDGHWGPNSGLGY